MEKLDTWTITTQFTIFAGDMNKEDVIKSAGDILESLTDGSDITGISILEAKRDEY
jgi:hypothetical protein